MQSFSNSASGKEPVSGQRPHLLMIQSGNQLYREYLMRSVARDYRVHLFTISEPGYEKDYVAGWSVLESTVDIEAVVAAAREIHARDPFDGVISWDESRVFAAAHAAHAMGLPGDPAYIGRCRDKHLTREALALAGVPQPASVLCGTVEEALAAAEKVGYPAVLKPRNLAGSMGVIKVHDPVELAEQWAFTHGTSHPDAPLLDRRVLVEEYADGYEVSVDAAVHNGAVRPLCLARKKIGYLPYAEEVGHTVDAADPLLADRAFLDVLIGAHEALGFLDGFTHTEIMMTAGGPKLIEVNARLGGDMIPYLGLRATGVDPGLAAAACAVGREPSMTPDRSRCGAVRFFYVEQEDTELATNGFDPDAVLPPEIDLLMPLMGAGAVTSPPPSGTVWGRIAYATAVGETVALCEAALDAAEAALRYTAKEQK